MMKDFVLELYSEEIPARMQKNAEKGFYDIFEKFFKDKNIIFNDLQSNISPCRISITAKISEIIKGSSKEIKGPKIDTNPKAIEGFCNKNKVLAKDLEVREIDSVKYYFFNQNTQDQHSENIIKENIESLLKSYVWPKSMQWSNHKLIWVRPLKNILCILDSKIIDFTLGHLSSNNISYGHKFMDNSSFEVNSINDYYQKLKQNNIIYSREERIQIIKDGISKIENDNDYKVLLTDKLIDEVGGLCEYPVVLQGKIDKRFMELPQEVLNTSINVHQKFFTTEKNNKPNPDFIFITNLLLNDYSEIISGNERVLSARLEDALFFYNEDKKKKLEDNFEKLDQIIFHKNIGSLKYKIQNMMKIATNYGDDAVKAIKLSKCDLVSEMVFEFPELQGIMGYYYAKSENISDEIAIAIRDHYKPIGADDSVPSGLAAKVALIDKLDSLAALTLAGEKATGSKDPFALRRMVIGVIRIILENNFDINLLDILDETLANHEIDLVNKNKSYLIDFIEERVKHYLKNHYDIKIINAAVDLRSNSNLLFINEVIEELTNLVSTDNGAELISLYKRGKNILENNFSNQQIDESLFENESERVLYKVILDIESTVNSNLADKNINLALQNLLTLKESYSTFFDENMINTDNESVSTNRKSILYRVCLLFEKLAKFNEI